MLVFQGLEHEIYICQINITVFIKITDLKTKLLLIIQNLVEKPIKGVTVLLKVYFLFELKGIHDFDRHLCRVPTLNVLLDLIATDFSEIN